MDEQQKQPIPIKHRHAFSRGRGTRFYAFRNVRRLNALKRFGILYGLMYALAICAVFAGIASISLYVLIWITLLIVTLGIALNKAPLELVGFGVIALGAGAVIIIVSILLRILLEKLFFMAERIELKLKPDGAEKYIKVMRAVTKANFVTLGTWVAVAGVTAGAYFAGFQNNYVVILAVLAGIAILIISRFLYTRIYERVGNEIEQIRAERENTQKKL